MAAEISNRNLRLYATGIKVTDVTETLARVNLQLGTDDAIAVMLTKLETCVHRCWPRRSWLISTAGSRKSASRVQFYICKTFGGIANRTAFQPTFCRPCGASFLCPPAPWSCQNPRPERRFVAKLPISASKRLGSDLNNR